MADSLYPGVERCACWTVVAGYPEETPAFEEAERERVRGLSGAESGTKHLMTSLRDVFVEKPGALAIAAGISIVWVVAVYTLLLYMPTYMQRTPGLHTIAGFYRVRRGQFAMAIGCVVAGRVSDRVGGVLTVRVGALLLLVATYPVLAWIVSARTVTGAVRGADIVLRARFGL